MIKIIFRFLRRGQLYFWIALGNSTLQQRLGLGVLGDTDAFDVCDKGRAWFRVVQLLIAIPVLDSEKKIRTMEPGRALVYIAGSIRAPKRSYAGRGIIL